MTDNFEIVPYNTQHGDEMIEFGLNDKLMDHDAQFKENRIDNAIPGLSYTLLLDDLPICSGGIYPLWDGVAEGWVIASKRIYDHKIKSVSSIKRRLDLLCTNNNIWRVQTSVKEDFKVGIRFAEWLGLENDGEIVYQHKNEKRHIEVAHMLLESGFAYRDWELEDDFDNLEKAHAIRFKIPDDGETIINDKVQGDVTFQNKEIEDFVLLRSDGTPTYMLSVVVDDYDMNISDIIRGDDHLINAAKQKLLYDSLKWDCPTFSHIPLIHGQDGSKLSKRHGSLGIEHYLSLIHI